MSETQERIRAIIDQIAPQFSVDPDVVEAIVWVESSGNPKARRYEAHQDRKPDGDTPGVDDGIHEDDASYGLAQIMGYTARKLGFKGDNFEALYDERLSIAFCCKLLLQNLRASAMNYRFAVARYNGGPQGNPRPDGTCRNQDYVDKVFRTMEQLRKKRQKQG